MSIKIVIMVQNLKMGVYEGMEAAARMGVADVHLSAAQVGFRPSDIAYVKNPTRGRCSAPL